MSDSCIFCQILAGSEPSFPILEDDDCFAFLTIRPVNPGHTLVIPKRHVDNIFDIEEPLYSRLFQFSKNLTEPLKRAFSAPRIGVAIEGFSVRHAHIHLVPVYHMAELDPNRGKPATPQELADVHQRILKELSLTP